MRLPPCPRLTHLCLSLRPWRWTGATRSGLWDLVLHLLDNPSHFPSLEVVTLECLELPFLPGQCNVYIDVDHAQSLSSVFCAIPTLKTVTLRSPEAAIPYRAVEREHILSMLVDLDARDMLVVV